MANGAHYFFNQKNYPVAMEILLSELFFVCIDLSQLLFADAVDEEMRIYIL